jgi:hypothetical protein
MTLRVRAGRRPRGRAGRRLRLGEDLAGAGGRQRGGVRAGRSPRGRRGQRRAEFVGWRTVGSFAKWGLALANRTSLGESETSNLDGCTAWILRI